MQVYIFNLANSGRNGLRVIKIAMSQGLMYRCSLMIEQAYATELHHLRKTSNMIGGAKLAMEQIQMRLGTMSDLGDIVVTLSPCMAMIKNINASVGSFMPQMSSSMQDLAGTLNDILGDASITNTGMIQDQPIGSEAAAILHEAQATLEGNAKNSLPDPPIHTELKNDILQKREVYT